MNFLLRFDPYSKTGFAICRICKSSVHQSGSHYCQGCAYKKGSGPVTPWATRPPCLPGKLLLALVETHFFHIVFPRNLRHVWEESSGHQELQTDLCVVVDTRTTGDMSTMVSCGRQDRSHSVIPGFVFEMYHYLLLHLIYTWYWKWSIFGCNKVFVRIISVRL